MHSAANITGFIDETWLSVGPVAIARESQISSDTSSDLIRLLQTVKSDTVDPCLQDEFGRDMKMKTRPSATSTLLDHIASVGDSLQDKKNQSRHHHGRHDDYKSFDEQQQQHMSDTRKQSRMQKRIGKDVADRSDIRSLRYFKVTLEGLLREFRSVTTDVQTCISKVSQANNMFLAFSSAHYTRSSRSIRAAGHTLFAANQRQITKLLKVKDGNKQLETRRLVEVISDFLKWLSLVEVHATAVKTLVVRLSRSSDGRGGRDEPLPSHLSTMTNTSTMSVDASLCKNVSDLSRRVREIIIVCKSAERVCNDGGIDAVCSNSEYDFVTVAVHWCRAWNALVGPVIHLLGPEKDRVVADIAKLRGAFLKIREKRSSVMKLSREVAHRRRIAIDQALRENRISESSQQVMVKHQRDMTDHMTRYKKVDEVFQATRKLYFSTFDLGELVKSGTSGHLPEMPVSISSRYVSAKRNVRELERLHSLETDMASSMFSKDMERLCKAHTRAFAENITTAVAQRNQTVGDALAETRLSVLAKRSLVDQYRANLLSQCATGSVSRLVPDVTQLVQQKSHMYWESCIAFMKNDVEFCHRSFIQSYMEFLFKIVSET